MMNQPGEADDYMRGYSDGLEQGKRGVLARAWVRLVVAFRGYW